MVLGVSGETPSGQSVMERELRERMELIERLAHALADHGCEDCEATGMDEEGAEWSLCGCAQRRLEAEEASYR
jgi:hypothetical protein